MIIEIDEDSNHDWSHIFEQFNDIKCKYFELRFYNVQRIDTLTAILKKLTFTKIRGVNIYLPYSVGYESMDFASYMIEHPRINSLTIHSTPNDYLEKFQVFDVKGFLVIEKVINDASCCGVIDPKYFSVNLSMFTESLQHNNCLNKKMSIDKRGNMKNCPSMIEDFGHITQVRLIDVALQSKFTRHWKVKKDLVDICKECEFRYACSDCRAYIDDPDNVNSKPLKCSYNPYINKWEGEKDYKPVTQMTTDEIEAIRLENS